MIFLLGDFPVWLPIFTLVGGVTTALIIGGIAAGAAAAAGSTAYAIQSGIEGNWPLEDPEAWFTGALRAHTGGLGQVIESAQGEPTIMEQLKGEAGGTSRGGGTGGVLQGATGAGPAKAFTEAMKPGISQQTGLQIGGAGSQPEPMGGGGAARMDTAGEEDDWGPDRGDILKGAWKDIAKGAATSVGGVALGGALGGLGSVLGGLGNIAGGAAPAAAAPAAAAPAATGAVAPVAAETASAAPSVAGAAMDALQVVPNTIGDSASGILQQTLKQGLLGAGKGALTAVASGEDPGRGALFGGATGAAGGVAGGVAGFGGQQFAPPPVPTIQPNPFPMPDIGAPSYVGGMAPGAPTLTSSLASGLAPRAASAGASGLVGELMTPGQPAQPEAPIYSSRPSYYDVYDIGGPNAAYGGRRPYWG
jgi:hypothetical protein